ncbi:MAG: hypothetical protein R3297_07495 [Desulfobulbales bacterium]|nr:hypothetical protein [Desulfobulbales bacterium]
MSKKIVSISYLNQSVEFIEAARSQGGNFTRSAASVDTGKSLQDACAKADEIHINGLFPTAQYDWETFPKVQEQYLSSLIANSVKRNRPGSQISARSKHIRDEVKDGTVSSLIAYQTIEKDEITSIFSLLGKFREKIKTIYSLPTALAGAFLYSKKPEGNSLLLWVRAKVAVIAIVSADGLIKVARTLPYGMPGGEGPDTAHIAAADFSAEMGREIMMTVNYFKQKFREPYPADMYVLGNDRLQTIFADFPLKNLETSLHFGLSENVPPGVTPGKFNDNVHLFGNLLADNAFNFLPLQEIEERKTSRVLTVALIGLVLLIGLAGLWTMKIPAARSLEDLNDRRRELRLDVRELETAIARLKPIEGRKKYYQAAFLDKKTGFISFLQQVAAVVPAEMVFDSFSLTPAESSWNCMITGRIKGQDWQKRLDTLRKFGRDLYSFSNVDIKNVSHSLGQTGMDASTISFQLSLQLFPGADNK